MTKHNEYLYATSGLLIILISLLIYLRLVFKLPVTSETSLSSNRPPPGGYRPQVWIVQRSTTAASVDIIHPLPTAPQNKHETERRDIEERRFRILTSVLHKKAVSQKGGDYDKIIFPHEEELSYRSIRNGYDEEAPPEQEGGGKNQTNFIIPGSPHQENESDNLHKTDIIVSAPKKLSSRRSKSMKGMHMFEKSDRDISTGSLLLYSPKTCPICLEAYKAGDEICWSKNEKCPHAFHLECITEWLMENDDCPMCRENYLEGSNDELCAHPTT